jgi:Skp family chaperone for outer membrane proteins
MTHLKQGVLDVRTAVFSAPLVASLLFVGAAVLPAHAQTGGLPAAARPPATAGVAPAAAAAPAATGATAGTSVAVIDIPFVFKNHVRFKQAMDQFKASVDAFDAEMRGEQKKLAQTRDEILERYKPNTEEFKREEERLAKMQSDAQIKMALKKREFLEQEAKIYYNTYKEVEASVAQFADQHRIGLVLKFNGDDIDSNDGRSVMQGVNRNVIYQRNLDITEMVLKMVNRGATMPQPQPGPGPGPRISTPTGPGINPARPAGTTKN